MIIDSAKLNGPCSCGRSHEMITKEAIIEPGCLKNWTFIRTNTELPENAP